MSKKPLSKQVETSRQCIQTLDAIRRVEKQTAVITYRTYPSIKKFLECLAEKKGWSLNKFMGWQVIEAYKLLEVKKQ